MQLSLEGLGATRLLRRAYVGAPMDLGRMGTRLALSTSLVVKSRATRSRYALIESDLGSNSFRHPYCVAMNPNRSSPECSIAAAAILRT